MLNPYHRSAPLVLCALGLLVFVESVRATGAAETCSRSARIVLFVPVGSETPPAFAEKLRAIAARAEAFFASGIEGWGWEIGCREIFARNADGEIAITLVRGTLPDEVRGRAALPLITRQAIDGAVERLDLDATTGAVWWTFYHCPDHDVRGFRGGGGRNGGRAINAYPSADGDVAPDIQLAAREMWPLNLKGCVHEFGHALGLPHIGPRPARKRGNTLMGPVNRAFAARASGERPDPRVYLSEASAAMLAKHPLFTAGAPAEAKGPLKIDVSDLSFEEAPSGGIEVKGTMTSDVRAHSVLVLDSTRGFGDYWARPYCARVGDGGEFSVVVSEPFTASSGILTLCFCLEDGRNSATGRAELSRGDRIEVRYEGEAGEREFTRQAPTNPRRRPR